MPGGSRCRLTPLSASRCMSPRQHVKHMKCRWVYSLSHASLRTSPFHRSLAGGTSLRVHARCQGTTSCFTHAPTLGQGPACCAGPTGGAVLPLCPSACQQREHAPSASGCLGLQARHTTVTGQSALPRHPTSHTSNCHNMTTACSS